jgi:membrane protease YdiL (CAAX protease family)
MEEIRIKQYPTVLQAIHLVILYIFIQTVVDFPLALIDYFRDTDYLYNPVKKILLGIGSVVFILWYGFKKTGNPLKVVFPLKRYHPLLLLLLVFFFLGVQQLLNVVNIFVEEVLPPPAWFWEMFNKVFDSDFGFWGAFMKVVIIAPITEELIFRGVIMHGLMRNYSRVTAIFLSGLLFALFHLNPWQFPATFILGIILGWLMIRTHNILVCIAGHSINNLLVLLTISFQQQLKESHLATLSGGNILIISIIFVVLSVVFMFLATKASDRRRQQRLTA